MTAIGWIGAALVLEKGWAVIDGPVEVASGLPWLILAGGLLDFALLLLPQYLPASLFCVLQFLIGCAKFGQALLGIL